MIAFIVPLRDTTRNIVRTRTPRIMDGVAVQTSLINLTPNVHLVLENAATSHMDIHYLNICNVLILIQNAVDSKRYKLTIHYHYI